MNRFDEIRFKGDFRSYQQRVLGNVDKYLADGKVNIVAAPGSGKTILGLELMRKLGEPCLILSPTKDSRDRWGKCLKELFLEEESQFEEFFSTDLHSPKLINCITYEALSMAMERTQAKTDGEISYFDIDFLRVLRRQGITTLCMEEPHHLGNDKQKALEKFLECMGEKVTRICLTAIPPYDLDRTEWSRYYSICGEIDEEIFAPELVAQGSLCPHQDYVYFNYPTAEEMQVIQEHRDFVKKVLKEVGSLKCIQEIAEFINSWHPRYDWYKRWEKQFPSELEALLVLLQYWGKLPNRTPLREQFKLKTLPQPNMVYFQRALQFLVGEVSQFKNFHNVSKIRTVLERHQLCKDKKVTLCLSEETRKNFTFSVGKLKSIGDITLHEYRNLGNALRMMILTDFNRGSNENLNKIGTDEPYEDISVVSIFETLRRLDDTMNIAVLSGSFIILPKEFVSQGTMVNLEPFEGTRYAKVEVYGTPCEGMDLIRELLREGRLQILIGTNALLEEGWDEPCMNTLILANYVEPFVSSNQMRGLVIKSDPQNPEKTANIWHLVTLESQEMMQETLLKSSVAAGEEEEFLFGYDYSIVKRRLATFMTPDYETGNIENGIERLSLIQPPFDEKSVAKKNKGMLELAGNRSKMSKAWKKQLMEAPFQVIEDTAWSIVPCMPVFRYMRKRAVKKIRDYWLQKFLGVIACLFLVIGVTVFCKISKGLGLLIILLDVVAGILPWLMFHFEPILCKDIGRRPHNWQFLQQLSKSGSLGVLVTLADNVRRTLAECGFIASDSSVVVEKVGDTINWVRVRLQNATRHDQDIFSKAIGELLAPIGNPRYKLVPKEAQIMEKLEYSLDCPSIIGQKERTAKILEKYLAENLDFIELVETNRLGGVVFEKYHKYHASMYSAEVPKKAGYLGADTKYIVVKETNTKLLEDKETK